MAYRVVSEINTHQRSGFTRWNDLLIAESEPLRVFCEELEDGAIFRKLGILNLLEGDFFSWYADNKQWNEKIKFSIMSILQTLGRYEQAESLFTSASAVDLFKYLYEEAIPQPVRSSFGEFYTPNWLSSHVIDSVPLLENWRLLDPCTGSGTFVISAIKRLRSEQTSVAPDFLLDQIVNRIMGIDLNPLAVLTTRVNYFINIADLIPDNLEQLIIPVFLGDASNVPERVVINKVECVTYNLSTSLSTVNVTLPLSMVKDTPKFLLAMVEFERAIAHKNGKRAKEILLKQIPEDEQIVDIINNVESFVGQLMDLEQRGWNGIWARILTNFLTTAAMEPFDAIVGNPPWIDWKNLPEGYRDRIVSLCIDRGLFSGDGRTGGINLNICALISHVSIVNWLKTDGKLAFLMPRELAFQ
jgi:hypothetical protein